MVQPNWRIAAPLLVITAGMCWGLIALFSNVLADAGFSSVQITLVRCGFSAAVLALFLAITNRKAFRFALHDIWMFLGSGIISIAFFNVCYFTCIQQCSLSLAAILLYTAPCFVVLLSAVLFKERLTTQKLVALVLAFGGCVLVVGVGTGGLAGNVFGVLAGLGSGIGYALYSIFGRFSLRHYSPITLMFYTFFFATLALLPLAQVGEMASLTLAHINIVPAMIALVLVSTITPFACYTTGLSHMEAGKASIMAFVEPMVAVLLGVFVFGDVLNVLNVCGIVLIVGAVLLLNMPLAPKQEQA